MKSSLKKRGSGNLGDGFFRGWLSVVCKDNLTVRSRRVNAIRNVDALGVGRGRIDADQTHDKDEHNNQESMLHWCEEKQVLTGSRNTQFQREGRPPAGTWSNKSTKIFSNKLPFAPSRVVVI